MSRLSLKIIVVFILFLTSSLIANANSSPTKSQTNVSDSSHGRISRTTKLDPTSGEFNSLKSWIAEIKRLYPNLKLILKHNTPQSYFALFSAASGNERIAVCTYEEWEEENGGSISCSWDVIGQNGKSILNTTNTSWLSKTYKHRNGSNSVVAYGLYYNFKNDYTGTARIKVDNKIVGKFEISKLKHS